MNRNTVAIGVSVLALVLAVVAVGRPGSVERVVERLGVSAGPEHTEHQVFRGNVTDGGEVVATSSTASTYTLTNAELREEVGYISWTPNVNTTLTSMASTSEPFSGLRTGESISWLFYNASTTAGATVTFAAGTGVDLQEDEGGSVIVNGLEMARLTAVKKSDSDVALIVEPYQVAD